MAIIGKASHRPVHPGEMLREAYLEPMKVSITQAAAAIGVSRKHLSQIVNGRVPVTPDMAMRFAVVFSTEAAFWINLQARYYLWIVSQRAPPRVKPLRATT